MNRNIKITAEEDKPLKPLKQPDSVIINIPRSFIEYFAPYIKDKYVYPQICLFREELCLIFYTDKPDTSTVRPYKIFQHKQTHINKNGINKEYPSYFLTVPKFAFSLFGLSMNNYAQKRFRLSFGVDQDSNKEVLVLSKV